MEAHHVIGSVSAVGDEDIPASVLERAVLSLYWDQIMPTEADILRRLGELLQRSLSEDPGVMRLLSSADPEMFRVCEDSSGRRVFEFLCVPAWFNGWIDPNDTDYNFPIGVWEGVCHYSVCVLCGIEEGLRSSEEAGLRRPYQFKGGRYGLAKHLQGKVLELYQASGGVTECGECESFISGIQLFSLGRLCQLVQMSIGAGILRYEENLLQPAASCMLPCSALASRLLPPLPSSPLKECREITSLSELEEMLEMLFEREKVGEMPLSQLKKKMIGVFGVVINPARLGYVKLSELLRGVKNFTVCIFGNESFLRRQLVDPTTPSTVADDA
jgi:hypothetical protein